MGGLHYLIFTLVCVSGFSGSLEAAVNTQAYVSLLYGDSFLLGLRVLGQSLKETGTSRDLLALVTGNVSDYAINTLRGDGWIIREVDTINNPGTWTQTARHKFPQRFWAVYTKLAIFGLTDYERVVYLDADTIAKRNIDDLFLCDGFCAVMRHSERLNSGVMVLEPSEELFDDMMHRVANTPSYTGGDQGFLNAYFSDFKEAPFFDPGRGHPLSSTQNWTSSAGIKVLGKSVLQHTLKFWGPQREVHAVLRDKMGRLPTTYNSDIGLYVLNSNRWTVPPEDIRVLHYTLAGFKPWDWWTMWIMRNAQEWQDIRTRLPASSTGLPYGETRHQKLVRWFLLPAPLLLAALLTRRHLWSAGLRAYLWCVCCRVRGHGSAHAAGGSPRGPCVGVLYAPLRHAEGAAGPGSASFPPLLPVAAVLAGVSSVAGALGITVTAIVPGQMRPVYGWALAYMWMALLLVLLYSSFLCGCFSWGRRAPLHASALKEDSLRALSAGLWRPWCESLLLFALVLSSLALAPWWGDLLRTEAFAAKVVVTAAAGVVTALVCCQAFIELAASWYHCGRLEGGAAPDLLHQKQVQV